MSTSSAEQPDRAPLTRDRVVAAAIELADEAGTDGLSMRKLAGHLGFEAMSLYNHVHNKDDLFEAMADQVCAEVEFPPDDVHWKDGLRAIAISQHRAILRHPWVAPMLSTKFPGPARWQIAETLLGLLTDGGLTDHLRDLGYHAVTLHISGFTQQQLSYQELDDDEFAAAAMARFRAEVSEDRYPLMVDHVRYHEEFEHIPGDRPNEFQFVLDLILDGLERLRDGGATTAS